MLFRVVKFNINILSIFLFFNSSSDCTFVKPYMPLVSSFLIVYVTVSEDRAKKKRCCLLSMICWPLALIQTLMPVPCTMPFTSHVLGHAMPLRFCFLHAHILPQISPIEQGTSLINQWFLVISVGRTVSSLSLYEHPDTKGSLKRQKNKQCF